MALDITYALMKSETDTKPENVCFAGAMVLWKNTITKNANRALRMQYIKVIMVRNQAGVLYFF